MGFHRLGSSKRYHFFRKHFSLLDLQIFKFYDDLQWKGRRKGKDSGKKEKTIIRRRNKKIRKRKDKMFTTPTGKTTGKSVPYKICFLLKNLPNKTSFVPFSYENNEVDPSLVSRQGNVALILLE